MSQVTICEVSPRDGLQNDPGELTSQEKVELVERAASAGATRIEAVSFAHPGVVPRMADAEAVMAGINRAPGVSYAGLVMNERGLERALAARVDEVNVVVMVTDTFCLRNQNATTEEALRAAERVLAAAKAEQVRTTITLGASFGCPFEGEVPLEMFRAVVEGTAACGAEEVALADTIGVAAPAEVSQRVALAARVLGDGVALRVHLHNTRGTAVANAFAAIGAGATTLDSSIGGVGGCPFAPAATGNVATEDLVYALERSGVSTGINLEAVIDNASWLAQRLGHDVPSALLRAGIFPPAGSPHPITASPHLQ